MKRKKKLITTTGASAPTFPAPAPSPAQIRKAKKQLAQVTPLETTASVSMGTSVRRNTAGTIERSDRYKNIDDGLVPYRHSSSIFGANKSAYDVRDAVMLCQKCYYNFALFRNIIDLHTEFSISEIHFQGGNQQSRDFFTALFKKINLWALQDKFFREYYRSGNVFLYRFDAEIEAGDIRKIISAFASDIPNLRVGPFPPNPDVLENTPYSIPARYIVLNPVDIQMMSTLDFSYGLYFKILTDFEIARLRNPKTEEDIAVFNNLPEATQNQIRLGARVVAIPLDPNKVSMIFYKKQDYEPFSVPMGFPVLEDINAKAEMRKIDMAIARTMQQIVLLVTTGTEPEKGGVNQKNIEALRKIFENQTVSRTVISDFTTKAEFIIPNIGELLNPQKYEVIDNDINVGLNNIFAGGEKFANQSQKVEIFISRLEQGRQSFLQDFLIPEIKRISKSLNFKSYPMPYFEDIKLKDNTNQAKIYTRLLELGILTPEQGLQAIETNMLPDFNELETAQKAYKSQRDDGLYQPLVGGPKDAGAPEAGRPAGQPAAPKMVSPIGTGPAATAKEEIKYSLSKIKDNMLLAQELESNVMQTIKQLHNIKRITKLHKEIAADTATLIMANEEPAQWLSSVATYCQSPEDKNHDRVSAINRLAVNHQLNNYIASLLYASKVDDVKSV